MQAVDSPAQARDRANPSAGLRGPVVRAHAAGERPDDRRCPSCRELIPADTLRSHLEGLDGARLECPRQDLHAILERERRARSYFATYYVLRRGDVW